LGGLVEVTAGEQQREAQPKAGVGCGIAIGVPLDVGTSRRFNGGHVAGRHGVVDGLFEAGFCHRSLLGCEYQMRSVVQRVPPVAVAQHRIYATGARSVRRARHTLAPEAGIVHHPDDEQRPVPPAPPTQGVMTSDASAPYFFLPRELSAQLPDRAHVGDKGHHLAQLSVLKCRTPRFGLLSVAAFDEHVATKDVQDALRDAQDTFAQASERAAHAEALVEVVTEASLPIQLREALDAMVNAFTERDLLAVRASCVGTPDEVLLLAGHTDTHLAVRGKDAVRDAVRRCFASAYAADVLQMRHEHGLDPFGTRMGIIVQRMLEADLSGSCASLDVVGGDVRGPEVLIEATYGLGGGMSNASRLPLDLVRVPRPLLASDPLPDDVDVAVDIVDKSARLQFDKTSGVGTTLVDNDPRQVHQAALSTGQARQVAKEVLRLEVELGRPVSVDFAFVGRLLHLLQLSLLETPVERIEGTEVRTFSKEGFPPDVLGATTPMTLSVVQHSWLQGVQARLPAAKDWEPHQVFGTFDNSIWLRDDVLEVVRAGFGVDDEVLGNTRGWGVFAAAKQMRARHEALADDGRQLDADVRDVVTARSFASATGTPDELLGAVDDVVRALGHTEGLRVEVQVSLAKGTEGLDVQLTEHCKTAPPALLQDLLTPAAQTATLDRVRAVRSLVHALHGDVDARRRFEDTDHLDHLASYLDDDERPKAVRDAWDQVLRSLGGRAVCAGKLEGPSLVERRDLAVAWVWSELRHAGPDLDEVITRAQQRRQRAAFFTEEVLSQSRVFGIFKRSAAIGNWVEALHGLMFVRERVQALRHILLAELRDLLQGVGRRLVEHRFIEQGADVWFLRLDEVRGVLTGQRSGAALRLVVTERKRQLGPTHPAHARARSVGIPLESSDTFAFAVDDNAPGVLSPGEATGRLRFLHATADGRGLSFRPPQWLGVGDVVFVEHLDMGLLPGLLRADGVLVGQAHPHSMELQVLRGLGIPVVLCPDARDWDKGQGLRVDGTQAEVLRLDDAQLQAMESASQVNDDEHSGDEHSSDDALTNHDPTAGEDVAAASPSSSGFAAPGHTQVLDDDALEAAQVRSQEGRPVDNADTNTADVVPVRQGFMEPPSRTQLVEELIESSSEADRD